MAVMSKERTQQFDQMKAKHPDAILLFRDKSMYRIYKDDAVKAGGILGIEVADKKISAKSSIKVAEFKHEALDTYLPKLVRAGARVAICEQLKDSKIKKSESIESKKMEKEKTAKEVQPQQVEQTYKEEEKKQKEKTVREPQMVTVNGQNVTHGHLFQGKDNPDNYYFTVRLDGTPLKTKLVSAEDASAFLGKEIGIEDMMQKYHPTKLMPKVPDLAFKIPNVIATPEGNITVDKFNIYKEASAERPDFGKYKMYAQMGDIKMSMLAPQKALDEFFDKVKTPGQLVEEYFGEKLHLASAYAKYAVPEGVKVDKVRMIKNPEGHWDIKAEVNGQKVGPKALSYDDGFSFFKAKSATENQLVAKYFGSEIGNNSLSIGQRAGMEATLDNKSPLKR